ncbi:13883_t:CDS:1, partial [Racocetra persica]
TSRPNTGEMKDLDIEQGRRSELSRGRKTRFLISEIAISTGNLSDS